MTMTWCLCGGDWDYERRILDLIVNKYKDHKNIRHGKGVAALFITAKLPWMAYAQHISDLPRHDRMDTIYGIQRKVAKQKGLQDHNLIFQHL